MTQTSMNHWHELLAKVRTQEQWSEPLWFAMDTSSLEPATSSPTEFKIPPLAEPSQPSISLPSMPSATPCSLPLAMATDSTDASCTRRGSLAQTALAQLFNLALYGLYVRNQITKMHDGVIALQPAWPCCQKLASVWPSTKAHGNPYPALVP